MTDTTLAQIDSALASLTRRLMGLRTAGLWWEGELSSSALATATAVWALHYCEPEQSRDVVAGGLAWLCDHQNDDGGWGDTPDSPSNIATTMLCWSALGAGVQDKHCSQSAHLAQEYLRKLAGDLEPEHLAAALAKRYGRDKTFSAPILAMCATAGVVGRGKPAWKLVAPLPFELALLPHKLLRWLRLPVVSYALPALIGIGMARFANAKPLCPVTRLIRWASRRRVLRRLRRIQPQSGGFLEAVPLTSFVMMSLQSAGEGRGVVVQRGREFLLRAVRADGSWPIDTNLATWVTTLATNALACDAGAGEPALSDAQAAAIRTFLLRQQHLAEHPYTGAATGGWAWTNLSGGVPDADDTAGALLALANTGSLDARTRLAVAAGVQWLLGLQNRDGGVPTFCRGWGKLPFDRSSPDLTAHAISALGRHLEELEPDLRGRSTKAIGRMVRFLESSQRADGAWLALWFGNQAATAQANPTYGTAQVLRTLAQCAGQGHCCPEALRRGSSWLLRAQLIEGGWGGDAGVTATVEESAIAVDAVAALLLAAGDRPVQWLDVDRAHEALVRGVHWLATRINDDGDVKPFPIGLYFASLWYSERLYPLVFAISALRRARKAIGG